MKRTFTFSPSKKRKKLNKKEQEYVKIIVRSLIIYVVIVIISFFGFIAIFSNINNLWGIFRGKEIYSENSDIVPSKPFLKLDNEYTNEETISLEGVAESGKRVVLYKNQSEIGNTIADSENKYVFNDVEINSTENAKTTFYTVVADNNKESTPSNKVTIIFDKSKPNLSVSTPEPDERIRSYSRTLEVEGNTEEGAEVTVNGKFAIVSGEEFTATIALEDEVNVIKVRAKDKAGNESIIEVPVYYEKIDD